MQHQAASKRLLCAATEKAFPCNWSNLQQAKHMDMHMHSRMKITPFYNSALNSSSTCHHLVAFAIYSENHSNVLVDSHGNSNNEWLDLSFLFDYGTLKCGLNTADSNYVPPAAAVSYVLVRLPSGRRCHRIR